MWQCNLRRRWLCAGIALLFSAGSGAEPGSAAQSIHLDVYKSPDCGCCRHWLDHLESSGLSAAAEHPADLNAIKERHGIAPAYQACHTAVSESGFVFEGHVPARYIHRFLLERPAGAIGLAVPGMPIGSPGMEVGDHFTPYRVLLLNADGSIGIFAEVLTPAEQY